jgi:hypothetical protein
MAISLFHQSVTVLFTSSSVAIRLPPKISIPVPPYTPDLVPLTFRIFPKMKEFLASKWMAFYEEVKETFTDWLNGLAAIFHDKESVKFLQHMDKCLNHNGNYVEK